MSQQVTQWKSVVMCIAPPVMLVALTVGTGGVSNIEYLSKRGDSGYSLRATIKDGNSSSPASIKSSLETVRSALGISVSDTAKMFNVTRQTFYDWCNGSPPSSEKMERIASLLSALSSHQQIFNESSSKFGSRQLSSGKTFIEAIADGVGSQDAVNDLAILILNEKKQREILTDRIRNRSRKDFDSTEFESIT